jgi:MFS family permease
MNGVNVVSGGKVVGDDDGQDDVDIISIHNNSMNHSSATTATATATLIDSSYNNNNNNNDTNRVSIDDAMELLGMGYFQYQILVAAGLCFMADAMEVLLLSFLAPILQVEFQLTERQMDTIISVVFAGALLGTLILSPLGDMVGRRPMFRVTAAVIAIFGVLTAFSQSYTSLLIMRFLVGFGVGGLTVPFDTLAEFMPGTFRGRGLLYIEFFWTFGTLSVPLVAYFTLSGETTNWQLFVILCSVPCIVSTVLGIILVPESPRWILEQHQNERALDVLKHAAYKNGKDPTTLFPEGTVLYDPTITHHEPTTKSKMTDDDYEHQEQQPSTFRCANNATTFTGHCDFSSIYELFSPTWKRITMLLWGAWFGLGFLYYGTIIAVSIVFTHNNNTAMDEDFHFDYSAIFISASSEIFGLLIVLSTIDKYGRILSQTVAYYIGGVACFVLGFVAYYNGPRFVLIIFAFLARMAMMGSSCTTWVSTSEILTTDIRATGHGAANAMARLGGFIAPYLITRRNSSLFIGSIVLFVATVTAECSRRLPETAHTALGDAVVHPTGNSNENRHSIDLVSSEESRTINGNVIDKSGMIRRETMELMQNCSGGEPQASYYSM